MRKVPPYLLLDAWRGIAALWVVMTHACLAFLAKGENRDYLHSPLYAVSAWGQLGVVIFFVISGFCITGAAQGAFLNGRGVRHYAFDRVRRIYPPYLAASLLAIALTLLVRFAGAHHLIPEAHHPADLRLWTSPGYWISNVLLVQIEADQPTLLFVAWSLCYEVAYYVLIGVVLAVALVGGKRSPVVALRVFSAGGALLTFVSLVWLLVAPNKCHFPLERAFQFGLGVLLFLVYAAPGARVVRGLFSVALALTLALAFHWPGEPIASSILGQPSIQAQAGATFIFVLLLLAARNWDHRLAHAIWLRPLMWLGVISYSLYLVHPLVMFAPEAGLRRLGWDHGWYWVTDLVEICFAIFCGWLFHLGVERHFISSRQKKRIAEELPA